MCLYRSIGIKHNTNIIRSETPGYTQMFFCAKGVKRVGKSDRFKNLKSHIDAPHFTMFTVTSVLSKVETSTSK